MSRVISIINQFAYLFLVLGFYYIKVHLPMHQVQLDTALIDSRLEKHREVFSDSNALAIVVDDPNIMHSLESFANKAKNFFRLDRVEILAKSAGASFGEFEYVMYVEKGGQTELKVSTTSMNRFTLYYSGATELLGKLAVEAHAYLRLVTDSSYVPLSKAYATVYAKLLFLASDAETKALAAAAVRATRASPGFAAGIDKAVRRVAGEHVRVEQVSNFNVKNTFGVFVNSATPNEDQLKKHFQGVLDLYDEEFVESRPTLGLNLLIETVSKPLKPEAKRYHVYRNCLYLKTSPADAAADIERAMQYLAVHAFGLAKLSDAFREVFGREDYPAVLTLAGQLRERRVLKTSLVFLESLRYVNANLNLAVKAEHLQPLNEALADYEAILGQPDIVRLRELSDYNEHAYFYSTYLFEPYVTGLLLIVAISGVSPLVKIIKEQLILTLFYCRRKPRLDKDFNALSSLDWFFLRSFVAIDQQDFDSEDEDDKPEDPKTDENIDADNK
jgi:hypothetical protein